MTNDDSDEIEYDEHILDVKLAKRHQALPRRAPTRSAAAEAAENANLYRANCEDYCAQLEALDADLRAPGARTPVRDLLIFAEPLPVFVLL